MSHEPPSGSYAKAHVKVPGKATKRSVIMACKAGASCPQSKVKHCKLQNVGGSTAGPHPELGKSVPEHDPDIG